MNKIYQQAKDCHVVATMVYTKAEDDVVYAYTDADYTTKFKNSELKEAFVKGALVDIDGGLFEPVVFGVDENGFGYVSCVTMDEPGVLGATAVYAEPDEVLEELVSDY